MKNRLFIGILSSALLLSTGCSTLKSLEQSTAYKRGTNISEQQYDDLVVNTTTKTSIVKQYGEPQVSKVDAETGNLMYEYHYQQINHLSKSINQTVRLYFKDDLLVKKATVGDSQYGNPLTGN